MTLLKDSARFGLTYHPLDFASEAKDGPEIVPSARTTVQELIEDNGGVLRDVLPFVLKLVRDVKSRNKVDDISHEELVAVALAALSRCRFRLKPKSGAKLTTFAFRPIIGALQDYIESELRHYGRETTVPPEAFATLPTPNHYVEKISNRKLLRSVLEAMRRINPDGARVVQLHFLEGVPEYKIAADMGISSHAVAKLRKEAFAEIRRMIGPKPAGAGGWVADSEN